MAPPTLVQQLEQLQAILHAIPLFIKSRKQILPVIGLDDFAEDNDCISGLRNFQASVSKEIQVLQQHTRKPNQGSNFSPNAPYFIAVWNEIISAPPPITALGKTFPIPTTDTQTNAPSQPVRVDVVANEGRIWIRVNTIKNSKLMAEFREYDSYLTGSEDETEILSSDDGEDTKFPTDQDNSLLRMGRALIKASSIPLIGTNEQPKVVLRLTRLDPAKGQDTRIGQVVEDLRQLGLNVQLGERPFKTTADDDNDPLSIPCQPTNRVNLDLSVLIALISDLTHAELPVNREEAKARFSVPCQTHFDWKQRASRIANFPKDDVERHPDDLGPVNATDNNELTKHSRALFLQCLQEMDRGILNEIVERLSMAWPIETVQLWTTEEARDRALQIVEKVGGPDEKRRARVLFRNTTPYNESSETPDSLSMAARNEFWKDSRFPCTYFPSLLPIRVLHKSGQFDERDSFPNTYSSLFHLRLAQTCRRILQHAAIPHPQLFRKYSGEMKRAQISSLNAKLTMHTVASMLYGVCEGMTTLTANKASVRTLLREMQALQNHQEDISSSIDGAQVECLDTISVQDVSKFNATLGAVWIIEPRSLAENKRVDT